jgi:GT2 family glycosyltransferase
MAPSFGTIWSRLPEWGHDIEQKLPQKIMTARLRKYLDKNFQTGVSDEICESLHLLRSCKNTEILSNPAFTEFVNRIKTQCENIQSREPVDVTILLPTFNNLLHLLVCLHHLLKQKTKWTFEIIIADDCSEDETSSIVGELSGPIIHRRNKQNLGYLLNCNSNAAAARGKFLILLNDDTLVLPGWLDALINTLESDRSIGLAGSKLLFANGRLQEAGGIVWRDGTTSNFGRDDSPRRPGYNILRDVDYCTGASVAIGKELWRQLGGYNEIFAPAYFEDVDLAFRVRALGLRTVFQPDSVLIHFESVTHGTQRNSRISSNRIKFHERWKSVLQSHSPAKRHNRIFDRVE